MRLYGLEFDHLLYAYTQPLAELSYDLQGYRFISLQLLQRSRRDNALTDQINMVEAVVIQRFPQGIIG